MPCESVRQYEYERERERERKRKKKKEEELKRKQLKEQSKKIVITQAKISGWNLTPKSEWKYTVTKPYSQDKMEVEILDSGTIKITTDKISSANHMSAENFHRLIHTAVGGTVTITQKPGTAAHTHGEHTHTHA